MIIETKAGPARTRSFLQIGGEKPIAKTVDIHDFDDLARRIARNRLHDLDVPGLFAARDSVFQELSD